MKKKKVQMTKKAHMSVDYHENSTKITTKVLIDRDPVVKVILNKSTGVYEVIIIAKDGRLLEHWEFDENRQKSSFA